MFQSFSDVQTAVDALTARVNALDGQNLPNPSTAAINVLQANVAGAQETINQLVLTLDSQLQDLQTTVNNLQLAVNRLNGIS